MALLPVPFPPVKQVVLSHVQVRLSHLQSRAVGVLLLDHSVQQFLRLDLWLLMVTPVVLLKQFALNVVNRLHPLVNLAATCLVPSK